MEFRRFDQYQASESEFDELAAFLAVLDTADRPGWPLRSGPEMAYLMRGGSTGRYESHLWIGHDSDDGARTAVGWLFLPSPENRGTALIEIRVRPDLRRRGIATDLLRILIPAARAEGRTHVIGSADFQGSGEAWGATVGLVPTLRYVQQYLMLAETDQTLWDRPAPDGYRLQSWTGAAPEDLVASYAVARQAIDDSVSGDMSWDEPRWTPARVREEEARNAAINREFRSVVAIHEATGEVAGVTDVTIAAARPMVVQQGYTAVRREHRGQGLGLAMKAEQLRALVEQHPAARQVMTQTADLDHMASINRALGFQVLSDSVYIEAEIADIEKALGSDS
ncbi:mycothiol synthase [Catenulispora sp. GP43]|uniref:GNAT family N-acetyltransferase n=1 Tax=Catenulispora sp. GP43 TaxID=3156263 RepID=UPI003514DABB